MRKCSLYNRKCSLYNRSVLSIIESVLSIIKFFLSVIERDPDRTCTNMGRPIFGNPAAICTPTTYTVHHAHMRLTIRIYGGRIPYGARYTHRICMVKRNGGAHTVHRIRTVYGAAPYTVWHHILCMCSTVAGSRRTTLALCMARHHILRAHGAPRTRRRMHTQYMAPRSCHRTTHIQYMVRHEPRNPPPGKYSL